MTTDLEEYYNHITYVDERVAIYEDDKGNYFNIPPSSLLIAVQYYEMTKDELEKAVFNQLVPKDMIFKDTDKKTIVPKNEITHNDKDKYTLVDKIVKAKQVWIISNGAGIRQAYNDKESALAKAKEINKKIFEVYKIEVK